MSRRLVDEDAGQGPLREVVKRSPAVDPQTRRPFRLQLQGRFEVRPECRGEGGASPSSERDRHRRSPSTARSRSYGRRTPRSRRTSPPAPPRRATAGRSVPSRWMARLPPTASSRSPPRSAPARREGHRDRHHEAYVGDVRTSDSRSDNHAKISLAEGHLQITVRRSAAHFPRRRRVRQRRGDDADSPA